jgi:hypothetical protein
MLPRRFEHGPVQAGAKVGGGGELAAVMVGIGQGTENHVGASEGLDIDRTKWGVGLVAGQQADRHGGEGLQVEQIASRHMPGADCSE